MSDDYSCMEITASEPCIAAIKRFEGFRARAYRDATGVWTLGYGTAHGIDPGMEVSEAEADLMLRGDVAEICGQLSQLLRVPITQGQADALVDFCYNEGVGHFEKSTLLALINAGRIQDAADQFTRWTHAGDKVLPGLIQRRATERNWFLS